MSIDMQGHLLRSCNARTLKYSKHKIALKSFFFLIVLQIFFLQFFRTVSFNIKRKITKCDEKYLAKRKKEVVNVQ